MDSPELGELNAEAKDGNLPLLARGRIERPVAKVNLENLEDGANDVLIHARYEKLRMKDFGADVRALKDVKNFLDRMLMILNLSRTSLSEILREMLEKVKHEPEGDIINIDEAMEALYGLKSVGILAKTVHGVTNVDSGMGFDQTWLCALCELPSIFRRHVVIGRLPRPANLGVTCEDVQIVILVIAPTKEKSTKTAVETGSTFCTILSDVEFRLALHEAKTEEEFRNLIRNRTQDLIKDHGRPENRKSHLQLPPSVFEESENEQSKCFFGRGMVQDLNRRLPFYWSDFRDGVIGPRTPQKVTSTILFLYFACVLPNIAFGMLNDNNTNGSIGVKKILFSQCAGGLVFAFLGGQPLIVLLTTAPLALFTKIIYSVSQDFGLNFEAMFACVGLWNAFFLVVYSVTNLSKLMKFSTRSTEEIFSLFITFAFSADAIRDTVKEFNANYYNPACISSATSKFFERYISWEPN